MGDLGDVVHGDRRVAVAQQVELRAVAEHRAHVEGAQPGERGLRPLVGVGTAHGARQDGQRGAGEERPGDGGEELDGRFTHQPDGMGAVVGDAFGDVLRAGMHLRPRMAVPRAAVCVENGQDVG